MGRAQTAKGIPVDDILRVPYLLAHMELGRLRPLKTNGKESGDGVSYSYIIIMDPYLHSIIHGASLLSVGMYAPLPLSYR